MHFKAFGPAVVGSVEARSAADETGIRSGDRILAIDGRPLRDVIDCHVLLADGDVHSLKVERGTRRMDVTLDAADGRLGIQFENSVFGKVMTCNNRCMFCFVDQLPPGLRDSFYVKDDDYRLSFLEGNFITLTNLGKDDLKRIIADRLSPLYVSLHATDPALRRLLFGNAGATRALKVLAALLEEGIEVHIQIVLVKGINDGPNLEKTLDDISSEYRSVSSIGVVPVGITSVGRRKLRGDMGYDRDSAIVVLSQLDGWRKRLGERGPFASDEFFFLAGEYPPPSDYYGEYPQSENGVGLARKFIDGSSSAGIVHHKEASPNGTAVITAPMGAWTLKPLGIERLGVQLLICGNSLFGERVTVAGLLPGNDVARKLKGTPGVRRALVSEVSLSNGNFIDGISLERVSLQCGVEVRPVHPSAKALIDAVASESGDTR